jgi:hypothetical protein
VALKNDLARVARECPDLVLLNVDATTGAGAAMAKELGVTRFPTQQYYKNGNLVWQVRLGVWGRCRRVHRLTAAR